jgi:alginate O-acetyltransferase complex protein AlgI
VLFNSATFIFAFLPLALIGCFAAARRSPAAAMLWLVAASLMFYGWWNPTFLTLLGVSIGANYALSRAILATASRPRWQGWLLGGAVAGNLAVLVHYKYLAAILGFLRTQGVADMAFANPVLPLGISFFTFTQIGYLLDCRGGKAAARGPLDYALFVTFFPHLIAGPVLHHREIMPQFTAPAAFRPSGENIAIGIGFFTLGLLKKCLLADPISVVVAPGYAHADSLALLGAWQVALSYSLQLYFDFSGYSDMAVGLARMFNLRFPVNFNSPYKARSVIDYWQRWHMTLTRYLNLYLYNPIALAILRRRAARGLPADRAAQASPGGFASMVAVPIFLTMGLAGIWHGAGVTFLVFGLLHGAYLSVNHAWRILRPGDGVPARGAGAVVWRVGLTYLAVLVGSVFFRAPSLGAALHMLAGMAGLHGAGFTVPEGGKATIRAAQDVLWLVALYAIVWGMPNSQQIMGQAKDGLTRLTWRPSLPWAIGMGFAVGIGLLSIGGTGEFLYFQF